MKSQEENTMAAIISEDTFQKEVLESDIPVLVDFFAEWCGPCKMLAPVLEELSVEYEGRIKVCKCDVDRSMGLAARFQVQAVPTLAFFKGGKLAEISAGALPKAALTEKLNQYAG